MGTHETEVHGAERNVAAYREAAGELARQLDLHNYAEIDFQPGDGTRYPIIVLAKGRDVPVITGDEHSGSERTHDYLVVLASSFGNAYPWAGDTGMHHSYCAEKWARDGREWTGRVIATLLNALAPHLSDGAT